MEERKLVSPTGDNIKMYLKYVGRESGDWISVAENRGDYGWVLVNMVLKRRVAECAVKVLTSRGTAGLSSRILLNGVS